MHRRTPRCTPVSAVCVNNSLRLPFVPPLRFRARLCLKRARRRDFRALRARPRTFRPLPSDRTQGIVFVFFLPPLVNLSCVYHSLRFVEGREIFFPILLLLLLLARNEFNETGGKFHEARHRRLASYRALNCLSRYANPAHSVDAIMPVITSNYFYIPANTVYRNYRVARKADGAPATAKKVPNRGFAGASRRNAAGSFTDRPMHTSEHDDPRVNTK